MPNIHLYVHDPKRPALLQPTKNASSIFTTDADDDKDGGRWVTINGAAVHIGEKGNIDKGPQELVGKTENGAHAHHHTEQAKMHSAAAQMKGGSHKDTPLHHKAARAHALAAHHFGRVDSFAQAGNLHSAGTVRKAAERDAATAHEAADELRKRNPEGTQEKKQAPHQKPAAHAALHSDAEDDAKGSEPHHAEHKRLLKEYDKAGADWQRHAINNQITKNATAAVSAKADTAHKQAMDASKQAHETDEPEHHQAAKEAIDEAMAAHERAGGRGEKIKELEKLRKPHHARVLKEKNKQKAAAEKATAKAGATPPPQQQQQQQAAQQQGPVHHANEMGRHEAAANEAVTKGDAVKARQHANAYRAHLDAVRSHGSNDYPQRREAAARASEQADKKPEPVKPEAKKPAAPASTSRPKVWSSNRGGGSSHGSASALEKMAGHALKKAAEEAADQDPKHKK